MLTWTSIGRLATTVLAVSALAGCGALTPGSENDQGDTDDSPSSVSTELPDQEVTLQVAFTDGPEMVEQLATAFEEKHPQVTVEPQYTEFSDYSKNIRLTMTSDSPPDVAQYNVAMKELIGSGHIRALDDYQEAYGWTDKFPSDGLQQLTSDESGKVYGEGNLYGVPAGLSLTGIFYNKQLAAQLGIDVPPSTLEEFEQALETAKQAGETPINVGALDSGGVHLWAALLNVMMPTEEYRDWVNGKPDGSITGEDAVAATEKVAEWAREGYINDGANGMGQAQSTGSFAQGNSLFLMNGNWAAAQIAQEMGDNAGFFLMPGTSEDQPATGSGFSVSYTMSSETEHPDVAAAFLDFMASPEAAKIEAEGGFLPANIDEAPEQQGVMADLHDAYSDVIADDGLNVFPDFAAPAAYDEEVSGVQSLIAGEGNPESFLESLQQTRDEYHTE